MPGTKADMAALLSPADETGPGGYEGQSPPACPAEGHVSNNPVTPHVRTLHASGRAAHCLFGVALSKGDRKQANRNSAIDRALPSPQPQAKSHRYFACHCHLRISPAVFRPVPREAGVIRDKNRPARAQASAPFAKPVTRDTKPRKTGGRSSLHGHISRIASRMLRSSWHSENVRTCCPVNSISLEASATYLIDTHLICTVQNISPPVTELSSNLLDTQRRTS